jgi:hypothetical protein
MTEQPPHDPNVVHWICIQTPELRLDTVGDLFNAVRVCLQHGKSDAALRIMRSVVGHPGRYICDVVCDDDAQREDSLAAQLGTLHRLIAAGEHGYALHVIRTAMTADVVRTPTIDAAIDAVPSPELRAHIAAALHREGVALRQSPQRAVAPCP